MARAIFHIFSLATLTGWMSDVARPANMQSQPCSFCRAESFLSYSLLGKNAISLLS